MKAWLKIGEERMSIVYDQVAADMGLPATAVEKDFWVSLVLQSVFELKWADHLVFKGGTSLSKGWNLISRFSEDIDLAIDRRTFGYDGKLGSNRRTKLRKTIRSFVMDELVHALDHNLTENDIEAEVTVRYDKNTDADPSIIDITYKSLTEPTEYLTSRIVLEINARSLFEPFENREIKPLISPVFSRMGIETSLKPVPCVLPGRTFLEKVFLLHEEFQKKEKEIRTDRLSRHMYDLERIMDTDFADSALSDRALYFDIIDHRKHLTKVSGIDYKNHRPGAINLIPPDSVLKNWESDYNRMKESMIYGEAPSFDKLLERMTELMKRINSLSF